jgi:hypothetical protein
MRIHASITLNHVVEAAERHARSLDGPDSTIQCSAGTEGVEPDARKHTCKVCGEPGVYGADELIIMLDRARE